MSADAGRLLNLLGDLFCGDLMGWMYADGDVWCITGRDGSCTDLYIKIIAFNFYFIGCQWSYPRKASCLIVLCTFNAANL